MTSSAVVDLPPFSSSPSLPRPHWSHSAPLEKLTLCRLVKVSLYVWRKWCQIFVRGFSVQYQRLKKLWSNFHTFHVIQNNSKVEITFVKPTDLSTNSINNFVPKRETFKNVRIHAPFLFFFIHSWGRRFFNPWKNTTSEIITIQAKLLYSVTWNKDWKLCHSCAPTQ